MSAAGAAPGTAAGGAVAVAVTAAAGAPGAAGDVARRPCSSDRRAPPPAWLTVDVPLPGCTATAARNGIGASHVTAGRSYGFPPPPPPSPADSDCPRAGAQGCLRTPTDQPTAEG